MLLALLLAAMIMVPMVSAAETSSTSTQMVKVDPKTDTLGFVTVDVITIDPAVKNATPYYQILVLNDEGKQNLLNNIDSASSVVASDSMFTTEVKTSMKASLTNLWKKYPVIYETKKGRIGISHLWRDDNNNKVCTGHKRPPPYRPGKSCPQQYADDAE